MREVEEGRYCACHFAEKLTLKGTLVSDVMRKLGLE